MIKQCEGKVDATIDFVGNGSTAERSHKITRNVRKQIIMQSLFHTKSKLSYNIK